MGKLDKKELSVKEYSEMKNVTPSAVYKAIHKGRVAFKKIGSMYLIIV